MLDNIAPSLTVNTQDAAPSVIAPNLAPHNPDDLAMIEALQHENAHLIKEITAIEGKEEEAPAAEKISTALFDLNEDELATLMAMEDELYEEISLTEEGSVIDADLKDIDMIQEAEKTLTTLEAGDLTDEVADGVTDVKSLCADTTSQYVAQIAEAQKTLADSKALSDNMAQALSDLDPNMDNSGEGKAFIRKMYELRGIKADPVSSDFPQTPEPCVEKVAGKVIQLEDLHK